jgi:hypothetical protein
MESMANLIAITHAAVAMFTVVGVGVICFGTIFEWRWTENAGFRVAHFGVIAFVTLRLVIGTSCPLSKWEDGIRRQPQVDGLAARLAFRGVDQRIFTIGCGMMFAATSMLGAHSLLARRFARRIICPSNAAS